MPRKTSRRRGSNAGVAAKDNPFAEGDDEKGSGVLGDFDPRNWKDEVVRVVA